MIQIKERLCKTNLVPDIVDGTNSLIHSKTVFDLNSHFN